MIEQRYEWMTRKHSSPPILIPCTHLTQAYRSEDGGFDTPIKQLHTVYGQELTYQRQSSKPKPTKNYQEFQALARLTEQNTYLRAQLQTVSEQLSLQRKLHLENVKLLENTVNETQKLKQHILYATEQCSQILNEKIQEIMRQNHQLRIEKQELNTQILTQEQQLGNIQEKMVRLVEQLKHKEQQVKDYKWILDRMKQQDRPRSIITKHPSSSTADHSGKKRCHSVKEPSHNSYSKAADKNDVKIQELSNLWSEGLKDYSNFVQKRLRFKK